MYYVSNVARRPFLRSLELSQSIKDILAMPHGSGDPPTTTTGSGIQFVVAAGH